MIHTFTFATIDGYGTNDVDFDLALLNAPGDKKSAFETEIITPITELLNSPDQTAVLSMTAHSDRVDTEGLTREQRRAQELDVSILRGDHALQSVQRIIAIRRGVSPAAPVEVMVNLVLSFQQLVIEAEGAGAAVLAQTGDSLNEEQRRQNRRVSFALIRFLPT